MPAMSIEYRPRDSMLVNAVGSCDHIEFTLEDVAGIATITEIKRR
jgi:Cu/Ag efflux protein CusF